MKNANLEALERVNLPADQARAILAAMDDELISHRQEAITKDEFREGLQLLGAEMRESNQLLRAEFREAIAQLRAEMREALTTLELTLRREFETRCSLIETRFSQIETRFSQIETRISDLQGSLSRWVLTCIMAQTAVIAGAIYFAMGHLRK